MPSREFKIGDKVKLKGVKTGIIQYIDDSIPQTTKSLILDGFIRNTEKLLQNKIIPNEINQTCGQYYIEQQKITGIELDTYSINAGDGSLGGQRLFKTSLGKGYFIPKESITHAIHEGSYARLKGLIQVPQFNGKTVKIVSWNYAKHRWKVKLLHARQEKKYLGVCEKNLNLILDWDLPSTSQNVKLGDVVMTKMGLCGTVMYRGFIEVNEYIGLELNTSNLNGNNGTIRGKQYFKTNDGRGYFVKLNEISYHSDNEIIKLTKRLYY